MSEPTPAPDRRAVLQQALRAVEDAQARLAASDAAKREPIAIVGMGCRFPGGADDPERCWELLREGRDATREVPADRWDADAYYDPDPEAVGKMITRRGGFLDRVDLFDPAFFGISPREAQTLDPQQRLLLEVAWEALEDGGLAADRLRGSQTGVFVGITTSDYAKAIGAGEAGQTDVYAATGNALNAAAGRLSFVLGLHGPCAAVDTACSSSLTAIHLACQSLRNGECDLALAGGVNVVLLPDAAVLFSKWGMLAPDGRCKTFDAAADGFVRAEGCGVLALKRLSVARAAGDRILALIRGSAVSQDGASSGLTVPNGPAQQMVIRAALERAGVNPTDVDYVEAHGTGTPLGDPIEVEALAAVMDPGRPADRPLLIGSIKTNLGHTEAASGVAGLIKVVQALRHEALPPHLHLKELNPRIPWADYKIAVPTTLRPWPRGDRRRIAGVSSFGFSGTNAHVVLEEAPPVDAAPPSEAERPLHAFALSGRTEPALAVAAARLARHVEGHPEQALADVAFTANVGRARLPLRAVVLAGSRTEIVDRLSALAEGREAPGIVRGRAAGEPPKVAFLFTGQGSQYPGMGRQLFLTQPTFRKALERCADLLGGRLEKPLLDVMFGAAGCEGLLDRTGYTQPSLFALEWSLAELWRSWGVEPTAVLGHSVGEFVAAAVAGVLTLEDALGLLAERARLMDALPSGGVMKAVPAGEARVSEVLAKCGAEVSLAAVNGPEGVVISGRSGAVDEVAAILRKEGIECQALQVSHAFHSPLMEPMLGALDAYAAKIAHSEPRIDLVSNLSGKLADAGELTAGYWRRHARGTVRYADGILELRRLGISVFLEAGPAPVLSGMGQRVVVDEGVQWIPSLRKGRDDWSVLLEGVGRLFVSGVDVDWSGVDRDYPRTRVSLPTYPFQRERHWAPTPAKRTATLGARALSHPFLLSHTRLAHARDAHMFGGRISLGRFPYLRDHRVQQGVVVPATAYVEMALAAHAEAFGERPVTLRNIEYRKALFLSGDEERLLQVVLLRTGVDEATFHVATRAEGGDETQPWTLHAEGQVLANASAAEVEVRAGLDAIRELCPEEVAGTEFYRLLHERGNQWGPTFQGVARVFRGEKGEAWSEVRVPEALVSQMGRYHFHPAVADASGHVLTATVSMEGSGGPRGGAFVGGAIDEVRIYRRPQGQSLWSYARLRPSEGERTNVLVGDVRVFDETGTVVSELRGARLWYLDQDAKPMTRASVDDWLYEVAWREAPRGEPRPGAPLGPGAWLVVDDGQAVGAALAKELVARGQDCEVVGSEAAPALLARKGEGIRGVVYVRSKDPASPAQGPPARPSALTGVATAIALVRASANQARAVPSRLWFVTQSAQPVGEARLGDPEGAALWGLGRALSMEALGSWGGLVDVEAEASPRDSAVLVADEILGPDREDQVAFRGGSRFVPRLVRLKAPAARPPITRPDGAYLVTGGLGGLGLLVARWLVESGARRLVLMGRTPLPPRSEWSEAQHAGSPTIAAIRELEAKGASVHVATVDVSNAAELSSWFAAYRSEAWPPIRGVVHAAGVLNHRSALEEDPASLDLAMLAKVEGTRLLDELLSGSPLDFFVLFSSAASLLNSPMLSGYAAGNAFLDAFAHARRQAGRPALSVNWGVWAEVGMVTRYDAADVANLAMRGMGSLGPDQGLEALGRLMTAGATQAAVLPVDWAQWHERYPALARAPFLQEVVGGAATSVGRVAGARGRAGDAGRGLARGAGRRDRGARQGRRRRGDADSASGPGRQPTAEGHGARLPDGGRDSQPRRGHVGGEPAPGEHPRRSERDPARSHSRATVRGRARPFAGRVIGACPGARLPGAGRRPAEPARPALRLRGRQPARRDGRGEGRGMSDASMPWEGMAPDAKRDLLARLLREKAHREAVEPLSHGQRALWMLHQLAPASAAYNVAFAARILSPLDVPAFSRALQGLKERHEMLRATYGTLRGEPVVRIPPGASAELEEEDARDWPEEALRQRLALSYARPFDLEHGPVLRASLFHRVREDVLLITVHHIAYDGWSIGLLVNDLFSLYAAEREGRPPALSPLPARYADFVRWQNELLDSPRGEELWAFWRATLGGSLPVIQLPTDKPRPVAPTYRGGTHSFAIDADLAGRLRELARQQGATLYMVLLAAFTAVLHRHSGQEDILVGSPTAGRSRSEFEPLIGYFVNPVVLRTDLSSNPRFVDLVARVRTTVIDALKHADYPFPLLVQRLNPERDPSRSPVFQVEFNLFKLGQTGFTEGEGETGASRLNLGGVMLETLSLDQQEGQFDLSLELVDTGGALLAHLKYATDLVERETIERMAGHLASCAAGRGREARDEPVAADPAHGSGERQGGGGVECHGPVVPGRSTTARVDRGAGEADAEGDRGVPRGAGAVVRRAEPTGEPTGPGPEDQGGGAREAGRGLRRAVVGAGGGAPGRDQGRRRLRAGGSDLSGGTRAADARGCPGSRWFWRSRISSGGLPAQAGEVLPLGPEGDEFGEESAADLTDQGTPDNLAYVIFTSGSTGRPKGAMNTHRGICNRLLWMQEEYGLRGDRSGAAEDSLQLRRLGVGVLLAAARRGRPW